MACVAQTGGAFFEKATNSFVIEMGILSCSLRPLFLAFVLIAVISTSI